MRFLKYVFPVLRAEQQLGGAMSYFHTPSVALDCMVMHVRDLPALCLSAWLLLFAIEIPPPDVTFLCVVVEPFRMADKSKPAIRVSLRNFMTNRLLCRKQFVCEVEHPGRGTVHKKELQTKISQMFKIQVLTVIGDKDLTMMAMAYWI